MAVTVAPLLNYLIAKNQRVGRGSVESMQRWDVVINLAGSGQSHRYTLSVPARSVLIVLSLITMTEASKEEGNPFDALPDESLASIMDMCSPRDLAKCEMVCRRWRNIIACSTDCSSSWLRHACDVWRNTGWSHNVPPLPPRPMLERLGRVPVGDMRRALVRYDTTGLMERIDWMRLLRAKLVWGTSACPSRSPTRGWCTPEWATRVNDSKAAFLLARVEVGRRMPLESELSRQKWDLFYNHRPSDDDDDDDDELDMFVAEAFEIEFLAGREMTASSHPGMKFSWSIHRDEYSVPAGLQVENFPMHTFKRKANGLWIMSNAFVTIEQRAPPIGDLPLDLLPY
jgi:hypothetical protein